MAFVTFKQYVEKNSKEGESYFKFISRVLIPSFGKTQRNFYDLKNDEEVYVNTSRKGDKLLRDIGDKND
jgi:hypothetical protein